MVETGTANDDRKLIADCRRCLPSPAFRSNSGGSGDLQPIKQGERRVGIRDINANVRPALA